MMLTLDNVEFDDQLSVLSAPASLPVKKALIDQNGIRRNLAENARKAFPARHRALTSRTQKGALGHRREDAHSAEQHAVAGKPPRPGLSIH